MRKGLYRCTEAILAACALGCTGRTEINGGLGVDQPEYSSVHLLDIIGVDMSQRAIAEEDYNVFRCNSNYL